MSVKTDSFVVETNVHFPTDYNLLWDSSRKALDVIEWFKKDQPQLKGWRKSQDWFKELKNLSRAMGLCESFWRQRQAKKGRSSYQEISDKSQSI